MSELQTSRTTIDGGVTTIQAEIAQVNNSVTSSGEDISGILRDVVEISDGVSDVVDRLQVVKDHVEASSSTVAVLRAEQTHIATGVKNIYLAQMSMEQSFQENIKHC